MTTTIDLRLYATLAKQMPENAARYPISEGTTVADLVEALSITVSDAKLIFINGKKAALETALNGGERVGIFPPVGGG